jgi:hypothetical protein
MEESVKVLSRYIDVEDNLEQFDTLPTIQSLTMSPRTMYPMVNFSYDDKLYSTRVEYFEDYLSSKLNYKVRLKK